MEESRMINSRAKSPGKVRRCCRECKKQDVNPSMIIKYEAERGSSKRQANR